MSIGAMTKLANTELAGIESMMAPQMQKLRDQVNSTELVDDAREDSAALAAGAQGAVSRARSAGGASGTTRQQALEKYKAKLDANKAQVGAVNNATLNQSEINEQAQSKLDTINRDMKTSAMQVKLDAAKADQDYKMAQENLKTQKKNAKKSAFGQVAGTVLGLGAAALL